MARPAVSVSQITTFRSSFADDVRDYAAAGLDGLGIWELKLGDDPSTDAAALDAFEASGLRSASAVPAVPSILPLPLLGGPEDPAERLDALCRSLERLAPFRPGGIVCLTGTGQGRDPDDARATVVDGLRTLAAEAERLGLRIALEPYQRDGGGPWTIASSLPEALDLIDEAGGSPALGIQFDVWHLWNTDLGELADAIDRIAGVHVCDRRVPTRGWADRALPGEGDADVPAVLRALDGAGWDGLYDVEVFSDDGTFGSAYDDSLWAEPGPDVLRRAVAAFERAWQEAVATSVVPVPPSVKESR